MQTLEKPRKAWKNGPEKPNALQDEQRPSARGLDLKERLPFRLGLCEKKNVAYGLPEFRELPGTHATLQPNDFGPNVSG